MYKCADCGANLDPGEKCDCRDPLIAYGNLMEKILTNNRYGQLEMRMEDYSREINKGNNKELIWN